jgi:hypothetical protein
VPALPEIATGEAAILPAIRNGEERPEVQSLDGEIRCLTWRQDDIAKFRPLEGQEAMTIAGARDGAPFAILCGMIATFAGPDSAAARAAGYLAGWFQSGLIVSMLPRERETGADVSKPRFMSMMRR